MTVMITVRILLSEILIPWQNTRRKISIDSSYFFSFTSLIFSKRRSLCPMVYLRARAIDADTPRTKTLVWHISCLIALSNMTFTCTSQLSSQTGLLINNCVRKFCHSFDKVMSTINFFCFICNLIILLFDRQWCSDVYYEHLPGWKSSRPCYKWGDRFGTEIIFQNRSSNHKQWHWITSYPVQGYIHR